MVAQVSPRLVALALAIVVLPSACSVPGSPVPSGSAAHASPLPAVSPSPSGTSGSVPEPAAKYRLIDAVGQPFFCDPDFYPVARADEAALAAQRLPGIRADGTTYSAIADRLGIDPAATLTPDQRLAVYRQWKLLRAIVLHPDAGGWSFDVAIGSENKPASGERVGGTIDRDGTVHVTSRTAAGILSCPICLARGTGISTPKGLVAVESLRVGDPVWTFDRDGRLIAGHVLGLGSTPVPAAHEVVRLVLSDGRILEASPGHPLLDGRLLGSLRPGDLVAGALVASVALVPYAGGATYDLLASGPTGGYIAGGIPMASTIAR